MHVCLPVCGAPWWVSLQHSHVAIIVHRQVQYRALSALCVYSKFGHHPHPLGYLCAKFHFFRRLHCELAHREKSCTQSLNHLPSLLDPPGTVTTLEECVHGGSPSLEHSVHYIAKVLSTIYKWQLRLCHLSTKVFQDSDVPRQPRLQIITNSEEVVIIKTTLHHQTWLNKTRHQLTSHIVSSNHMCNLMGYSKLTAEALTEIEITSYRLSHWPVNTLFHTKSKTLSLCLCC